jgi:hypothetical protein
MVTITEWFRQELREVAARLDLAQTAPLYAFKAQMSVRYGPHARRTHAQWSALFDESKSGLSQ